MSTMSLQRVNSFAVPLFVTVFSAVAACQKLSPAKVKSEEDVEASWLEGRLTGKRQCSAEAVRVSTGSTPTKVYHYTNNALAKTHPRLYLLKVMSSGLSRNRTAESFSAAGMAGGGFYVATDEYQSRSFGDIRLELTVRPGFEVGLVPRGERTETAAWKIFAEQGCGGISYGYTPGVFGSQAAVFYDAAALDLDSLQVTVLPASPSNNVYSDQIFENLLPLDPAIASFDELVRVYGLTRIGQLVHLSVDILQLIPDEQSALDFQFAQGLVSRRVGANEQVRAELETLADKPEWKAAIVCDAGERVVDCAADVLENQVTFLLLPDAALSRMQPAHLAMLRSDIPLQDFVKLLKLGGFLPASFSGQTRADVQARLYQTMRATGDYQTALAISRLGSRLLSTLR